MKKIFCIECIIPLLLCCVLLADGWRNPKESSGDSLKVYKEIIEFNPKPIQRIAPEDLAWFSNPKKEGATSNKRIELIEIKKIEKPYRLVAQAHSGDGISFLLKSNKTNELRRVHLNEEFSPSLHLERIHNQFVLIDRSRGLRWKLKDKKTLFSAKVLINNEVYQVVPSQSLRTDIGDVLVQSIDADSIVILFDSEELKIPMQSQSVNE